MSLILFVIFTDRILKHSQGEDFIWFGKLRVALPIFADDAVLFTSSDHNLEQGWFAVECKEARR